MAIFKANYVRRNERAKANAKGSVRYIQHRRGKDGEKITRPLYGPDGLMERSDAYRMIDDASQKAFIYRFVISPDPATEDNNHDLDMRDIAEQTMAALEERFGVPLNWIGATHSDHAPHLHAHLIAIAPHKLYVNDLQLLRQKATQACLEQRLFIDHSLYRERERPYPVPSFDIDTSASWLDPLSDLPEPRHVENHEDLPVSRQTIRYPSGNWGRYEKRASYQRLPTGGSSPPDRRQYTCTCPRCQAVHVHQTRDPVHRCDPCGLVLHRQQQLRLNHGKGRELGWNL
jgi:hypothetical protein